MKAPRLNRALVLERVLRAPDRAGGFTESWETLGTVWADVEYRGARSDSQAGLPLSAASYRVTVRAYPVGDTRRPVPGQRFRDGSRLFAIIGVGERDAQASYLVCMVEEVQPR